MKLINAFWNWLTYRSRTEEQLRYLRVILCNDSKWFSHGNKTAEILCNRYLALTDPNWKKYPELSHEEIRTLIAGEHDSDASRKG